MKHFAGSDQSFKNVKRPMKKTLLLISAGLLLVLCTLVMSVSFYYASSLAWQENNERLTDIINYVENRIDADDLQTCKQTGVKSEEYASLQLFMNDFIDRFDIEYLYVVVPMEDVMTNVISATSTAEREAGEDDMALLETTDAYSKKELQRYMSFYGADDDIHCFEETSEYGTYFTACKTLYDSTGKPVALICVDRDMKDIQKLITRMMFFVGGAVLTAVVLFAFLAGALIRKNLIRPVFALEKSAREFADAALDNVAPENIAYQKPDLRVRNEIVSLADAVETMANNLKENAEKAIDATRRAGEAERANALLEEKAKSAMQIAKLSESVTSLLNNTPAMTFYKDIETGQYLMCNQAFAEYCKKSDPSGVIGLTDYELFHKEAADHFVECDKIALSMKKPYVFFEDVQDGDERKQFRTTKLKFTDADGVERLLGMCVDMTEMVEMREENKMAKEAYEEAKHESLTYARIASALSLDYVYLYYINVETNDFIEYRSLSRQENLSVERSGKDFFNASLHDAKAIICKDDHALFFATFSKENVLKSIDEHGMFTMTYRMLVDGKPTYVTMKASRFNGDENHIIIGVNNIDAQMKEQEETKRIHEEQITYSRINALSGHYICIYTVDPETEKYTEYSATKEYEGLGLEKSGDRFFERAQEQSAGIVYEQDLDLLRGALTKDNVLKEIKERGIFSVNYRLMIKGVPTYVALRAAVVEEKDGPQLIVGVSNIDARVRREQAYAQDLSAARKQADSDALTGVKNKHAYIDAEGRINQKLEEGQKVDFAVVICDVNGLKVINDTQGHVAGDEYIRKASHLICSVFTQSPVFRVGGDEFAVIVQGDEYARMDELLALMEEKNRQNRAVGEVTVACGMAKRSGEGDVASVFKRADMQMYKNKRSKK